MAYLLDLAVSLFSLFVVALYAWSLRGHFSSPRMPDGAKVISGLVVATTFLNLFLVWFRDQPAFVQIAGLALEIASAALFWWAIRASRKARLRFAFDPDNPDSIVSEGPYRYVRHPFYTSYLMFWSGWALSTGTVWAFIPVIAFVVIYVRAARDEERKFSRSPLASTYRAYQARTGFLWPKVGSG
jgi:protein-S-isoprenylcysteine O-methyltransferase Ste14